MSRFRALIAMGGAAAGLTAVCAAGLGAHPAAGPGTVTVAGSAVPFTSLTAATGDLRSTMPLTIQVWLRPNLTAAQRFAAEVSTPGNPMFRNFLTPDAYTARFGPTTQEVSAVRSWLRSRGFTTVRADTQRDDVRATATVARVDAAFRTAMKDYPRSAQASGGGSRLYANDRSLTVPGGLAPDILGVTGLNNAALTVPLEQQGSPQRSQDDRAQDGKQVSCSAYWGQHVMSGLPSMFNTTTFPVQTCGYTPTQFRSAYGANMTNTGTGQTIAFAEAGGLEANMFKSLQDFTRQYHLPSPAVARYEQLNLQPASCKKRDESAQEEEMDVESAYAMARYRGPPRPGIHHRPAQAREPASRHRSRGAPVLIWVNPAGPRGRLPGLDLQQPARDGVQASRRDSREGGFSAGSVPIDRFCKVAQ